MKLWNNTPLPLFSVLFSDYLFKPFCIVAYFYSLHTILTPFSVLTLLTEFDTFFVIIFFGLLQ
jgi:hypothetical protein